GAQAEIAGRVHERRAKMMKPNAVDEHARGQRIVAAGDVLRQFEAATAFLKGLAAGAGENFEKQPRNFRAVIIGAAANEHVGIIWLGLVHQRRGAGRRPGVSRWRKAPAEWLRHRTRGALKAPGNWWRRAGSANACRFRRKVCRIVRRVPSSQPEDRW